MAKQKIVVEDLTISIDKNGYLSLTDIAKKSSSDKPIVLIRRWLRTQKTLSYLYVWEEAHNPNFKVSQKGYFRELIENNLREVSPAIYIQEVGGIGIVSTAGRYGGTYAHSDIALDFCRWLDPRFSVWVNKEFQRLKAEEQIRLGDPYNIKRHLTSGNYSVLVASILSHTDERLLTHPQPYKKRLPFAAEADMINKIVFGNTAKEWRLHNADKPTDRNQRDFASILDLTILNNLEFLAAMLLQWDVEDMEERRNILQGAYDFIYPILKRSKTIKNLQKLADNVKE